MLLGPPGSGKGTQAGRLSTALGVPAISTGEILRAQQQSDSSHGGELRRYLDRGELVPDSLVIEIIRHRLHDPDAGSGFILDGFPRTVAQGEALDSMLSTLERPIDAALYLAVPPAALIERLGHRHRGDDGPEVVRHRIEVYLEQTAPLIEYYRHRRRLTAVDADQPQDQVYQAIVAVLAEISAGRPVSDAAIDTSRLRLVLLPPTGVSALLAGDRQAAEKTVGLAIPSDFGGDADRFFLEVQFQRMRQAPSEGGWMVRLMALRGTTSAIGSIGFHGPPAIVGRAEMGYSVFPAWRRQGYATEAAAAMIQWAGKQGASSVFLSIAPDNVASLNLARRLGFRQVGEQQDEIDGRELVFELSLASAG